MFREIRKKRNKIEDSAAEELLQNSRRGVLAVNGDDGYPYAIPLNYFYDRENRKIYFHGARAGHKVDALRVCDKVCFTVYGNETIREEDWAPFMQSTVVFGRCHLMENGSEKAMEMLKRFAMKYYPNEQLADEEIAQAGRAVHMFGLDIVLDNDGNIILTEGLVLQEEKIWKDFLGKTIIPESNSCELYFEEQNIERFVEKLERLYPNIQYVNRLMTHSWGQKVVRFYDLDGNLIEVGTPM